MSPLRAWIIEAFRLLVDGWVLIVLTNGLLLNATLARAGSILAALATTWILHRRFSSGSGAGGRGSGEWTRFLGANGFGAGLNFAVYAIVLLAFSGTPPLLALAIGSAAAFAMNYLSSRRWAFRGSTNPT